MQVRFWGTRGSLPASTNADDVSLKIRAALAAAIEDGIDRSSDLDAFIERLPFSVRGAYGTNTPCVEVRQGEDFLICDAGSGLRDFGASVLAAPEDERPRHFRIFVSHLHWDHIQGFPFFMPAYLPGNRVTVYGCHEDLHEAFRSQQSQPFFPVELSCMAASLEFVVLTPGETTEISGFAVTPKEQNHSGKSYGCRIERDGKAVVYSTDCEHKPEDEESRASFIEFFDRADLVVFDAMFTLVDAYTVKEDWGHANNLAGVELADHAGVRRLCLFHHDPASRDAELDGFLNDTRKYASLRRKDGAPEVSMAWDGMAIEV